MMMQQPMSRDDNDKYDGHAASQLAMVGAERETPSIPLDKPEPAEVTPVSTASSAKPCAPALPPAPHPDATETARATPVPTRKRSAAVVSDGDAIYHVATAPRIGQRSRRRFAVALVGTVALVGIVAVLGTGFANAVPTMGIVTDPGGTHRSIASDLQATASAQTLPTVTPPRAALVPDANRSVAVQARLAQAEATLRTGQIAATVGFGNGLRTITDVRFDFGGDGSEPRFAITRTYGGATGTHTQELIAIGDRIWQRVDQGTWDRVSVPVAVREQVRALLPNINGAMNFGPTGQNMDTAFRWSDTGRNADVTLTVDGATGIPQQLQQVTHPTGATLAVTYTGWNTAVDVRPPT